MNFFLKAIFRVIPSDYFSKKYPVSVKGIVKVNDKIVLLKNEREEWELPGGKIELPETTEQCLIREIKEELDMISEIQSLVDVWMYNISGKVNVLIITFLCKPVQMDETKIKVSNEHKEVGFFGKDEIPALNMPDGYKNSILKALS
jgi:8-oxo-dGTP pyrophosphatase MutT (NUDIX family)